MYYIYLNSFIMNIYVLKFFIIFNDIMNRIYSIEIVVLNYRIE